MLTNYLRVALRTLRLHPGYAVPSGELYESYAQWAGKGAMSPTRFGRVLNDRGFPAEKRGTGGDRKIWRLGLRLAGTTAEEPLPWEGSDAGRVWDSSGGKSSQSLSTRAITPTTLPTLPNPPREVDLFGIREAEEEVGEGVRPEGEREELEL